MIEKGHEINRIEDRLYRAINRNEQGGTRSYKWVKKGIYVLIILNVITIGLSFFEAFDWLEMVFAAINYFSAVIFTLEYLLRVLFATRFYPLLSPFKARVTYLFSFNGIVDFMAILPFVLVSFVVEQGTEAASVFDLSRILLLFKITRYSKTFRFIADVFRSVRRELLMGWSMGFIAVFFSGIIMYYVEHKAQPDVFYDVGQGFWWSIITFTTVGYGDVSPITPLGKILASAIAFIGIGMIALPSGIISSAFIRKMDAMKGEKEKNDDRSGNESGGESSSHNCCPHCGRHLR